MRISVVVPCRDAARFLPTTLASISANAAEDVEWILVDDGSVDETAAILHGFEPPAGEALVLTNGVAVGLAEARNRGVQVARGRWITFLDADDWLAPGYLARLADAAEELRVDFVRTDHVQAKGVTRATHRAPEGRRWQVLDARDGVGTLPRRMTMVDYPYAWSGIYDAGLRERGLLTVDSALQTAEDRLMAWRLHLHADRYAVVGLLGYFYRREVAGSLTAIGDARQLHFFDAFDRIGEELADERFEPFRLKYVRSYLSVIAHHREVGSRLHGDVYAQFRRRASTTIRGLPQDLVAQAVATLEVDRARIVAALA